MDSANEIPAAAKNRTFEALIRLITLDLLIAGAEPVDRSFIVYLRRGI